MISVLLFGACIKDFTDTADKLFSVDGIQWNPTIAAPLVSSRLSLEDVLGRVDSDQFLRIDEDGGLTIVYQDDYRSSDAEDVLALDDQDYVETLTLTTDQLTTLDNTGEVKFTVNRVLDYNLLMGELDYLWFKDGVISIDLNTTLAHDVALNVVIKAGRRSGGVFSPSVNAVWTSSPNTASTSEDLSNVQIDFTKTAQGHSQMEVDLEFTITKNNANPVNASETVTYAIELLNQKFFRAEGLFIDLNFSAEVADTFDIPFFNNSDGGSFTIDDPRIKFVLENSIGIPVNAQIPEFSGISNTGNVVNLTGLPDPLPVLLLDESEIGTVKIDSFELNKSTSNLVDFINNQPNRIGYAVKVTAGGTGARHALLSNSRVKAKISVEIPAKGTARDYALEIVQPFDLTLENADQVQEVLLRLYSENRFPIDVQTQVYFEDSSTNTVLDSLFGPDQLILPAAAVDATGRVVFANPKTIDANMNAESVERLKRANQLRLRAKFNTPFDASTQPSVKFYSDYDVLLQLGVQAEVLIKQEF